MLHRHLFALPAIPRLLMFLLLIQSSLAAKIPSLL